VVTMFGELTLFLASAALVGRARPEVPHLDGRLPTSSYPSGHIAATLCLYTAIVIVFFPRTRAWWRWLLVAAAVFMPVWVIWARMYRGMHHPSDVVAGAVLGALCLVLAHHFVLRKPETVPTGRRLNPAPSRRSRTSRRPESRPPARPRRAAPGRR